MAAAEFSRKRWCMSLQFIPECPKCCGSMVDQFAWATRLCYIAVPLIDPFIWIKNQDFYRSKSILTWNPVYWQLLDLILKNWHILTDSVVDRSFYRTRLCGTIMAMLAYNGHWFIPLDSTSKVIILTWLLKWLT